MKDINKIVKVGIDIGSTTIKVVAVDDGNEMIFGRYKRHFSEIKKTLQDILSQTREVLGNIDITAKFLLYRKLLLLQRLLKFLLLRQMLP